GLLSVDGTGNLQVQLGSSLLTAAVPLEAGQWHHVAWRVESGVHTLFIDGQPQGDLPPGCHGAPGESGRK
ncbi:MAG: LamG-like jellyroll fold domain-containing protein, partial [Cyanobacteria bacterium J06636_28]